MDHKPAPFVPPAPVPRTQPPSMLQMMRIVYRNPLELWGEPSYNEPYISVTGVGGPLVIANDPALIRHVLVDNVKNYRMATVRQMVLRPILRDGLLTAEGDVWKRSRKAMAPIFTPRHIFGFARPMLERSEAFAERYEDGGVHDIAVDMTNLTYDILAETLFSGEIAGEPGSFAHQIDRLFETMGRVDPLDLLRAPEWLPRLTRIRGRKTMAYFRSIVADTIAMRSDRLKRSPDTVPGGFSHAAAAGGGSQGPDPWRDRGQHHHLHRRRPRDHRACARLDASTASPRRPGSARRSKRKSTRCWRASPIRSNGSTPCRSPAPPSRRRCGSIRPRPRSTASRSSREQWRDLTIPAKAAVLIMPWTVHRHRKLWENPDAFMPQRFHPENRGKIDRYQYLPFGAGPRVCIGATFAMQEAVIALAVLMSRYRFDTTPDTKPWPVQKLTTQPQGGLPMRVTRR